MKSLFILTLFILILEGCGESSTETDNSKNVLWPLAIGNSWTSVYYTTHDLNNDTIKHDNYSTTYVSDVINLEGETWYVIASNGKISENIVTNRSDGIYGIYRKLNENGEISYNLDSARRAYKYPVVLHESYPINQNNNGFYIADINARIITKAGTFSCIKYVPIEYKDVENFGFYICPGIGLIKSVSITYINETQNGPDTSWVVQELVNYIIR